MCSATPCCFASTRLTGQNGAKRQIFNCLPSYSSMYTGGKVSVNISFQVWQRFPIGFISGHWMGHNLIWSEPVNLLLLEEEPQCRVLVFLPRLFLVPSTSSLSSFTVEDDVRPKPSVFIVLMLTVCCVSPMAFGKLSSNNVHFLLYLKSCRCVKWGTYLSTDSSTWAVNLRHSHRKPLSCFSEFWPHLLRDICVLEGLKVVNPLCSFCSRWIVWTEFCWTFKASDIVS